MNSQIKLVIFVLLSLKFGAFGAPLTTDSTMTTHSAQVLSDTEMPATLIQSNTDKFDILSTNTEPTTKMMMKLSTMTTDVPKKHYTEHHLEKSIDVDLYNPCQILSDESWHHDALDDHHDHHRQNHHYEIESDITQEEADSRIAESSPNNIHNDNHSGISDRDKAGLDLLLDMEIKVNSLQNIVTDMIRKHLISECRTLDFADIIHMQIPKDEITKINLVTNLHNIYKTLVNQTAHLYFIHGEQKKAFRERNNGCNDNGLGYDPTRFLLGDYFHRRSHSRKVANDFFVVGSNLRGLMCQFQQAFAVFRKPVQTQQIVTEVLTHRIRLSTNCSRMQIVDCQLMRNSVRIFSDIGQFLRRHSHHLLNEVTKHKTPRTIKL